MKQRKAERILQKAPWLKSHLATGGVFSGSRLNEKQLVNYIRGQLKYISTRPFTSLNLYSSGETVFDKRRDLPSYRLPYKHIQYILRWHYAGETRYSQQTVLSREEDGTIMGFMETVATMDERHGDPIIIDAIIKKIRSRELDQKIYEAFEIFSIPNGLTARTVAQISAIEQADDEDIFGFDADDEDDE